MSAVAPVSAVLITLDAERVLERVLRPLAVCAEIVVLDSGSRDRTREIALGHGARWHEHRFDGYGPQKRRAVTLARHDWVLSIDADEVLDEQAAAAIADIDWGSQDPRACWRVRRRPFIGAREIRHGHWVPDDVVRLFHRGHHEVTGDPVHESVRPSGPVYSLPGSILHYSYRDLADLFRADYHRLKAASYRRQGRRAGPAMLVIRATAAFLGSYLVRAGFLDGPAGVVVAVAAAASAVTGLAMASELRPPDSGGPPDRVDESCRDE